MANEKGWADENLPKNEEQDGKQKVRKGPLAITKVGEEVSEEIDAKGTEVWVRFILPEEARNRIPIGIYRKDRNPLRQQIRTTARKDQKRVKPKVFLGKLGSEFIAEMEKLGFYVRTLQYLEDGEKFPVVLIFDSDETKKIKIPEGTMEQVNKLMEHAWPAINVFHNEPERDVLTGKTKTKIAINLKGFFAGCIVLIL